MLSDQDRIVLQSVSDYAPYLSKNFETALNIPCDDRYVWAQDKLYDVKRFRFVKRGVPVKDAESVGEHTLEAIGLATLHTPYNCNRDIVEKMILVHDMPQAIIDNLKCENGLPDKHKKYIEKLAAKIVFSGRPAAFDLWCEYESGESHEARVAKDIQHLQMMMRVSEYQADYPDTVDAFQEYWNHIDTVWVSDIGYKLRALLRDDARYVAANDGEDKRISSNSACFA